MSRNYMSGSILGAGARCCDTSPPPKMLRWIIAFLVAACAIPTTLGCSRKSTPSSSEPSTASTAPSPLTSSPLSPSPGPDVAADESGVVRLDGPGILQTIRSSDAKFTLLNFWASWCGPCRQEFPMLIGLSANLEKRGLRILFVSLDEPESIPGALEFAQQNGLNLPILVAERPISALKAAIHPGWPGMLPVSFLFDKAGTLKHYWGGPVFEHELLPVLEQALSGQEVSGETHFGLSPGKDLRKQ
jgi:thiol-disulfide isomerase/thioredoxin